MVTAYCVTSVKSLLATGLSRAALVFFTDVHAFDHIKWYAILEYTRVRYLHGFGDMLFGVCPGE